MKSFSQYFKVMSISLSVCSFTALAGGVVNGGVSVVCRDQAGKIKSAEVLDIYEGQVIYGRKYDDQLDIETKIELSQLKMTRFPKFSQVFQEELTKVKAIMVFIPKGNQLTPTNDAFPEIVKEGCHFEQLANYTDENELLVSQEIFDELDEVNKAALYVHETVYSIVRQKLKVQDSQLVRKLTAQLLAKNVEHALVDSMLEKITISRRVCGNIGTVEERIIDCNEKIGDFPLVARTQNGSEVFKDIMTGHLWSQLSSAMGHATALRACTLELEEFAGISSVTWRLPSIEDYKEAMKSGFTEMMPTRTSFNMGHYIWTSSVHTEDPTHAWIFNSHINTINKHSWRFFEYTVRCMGVLDGEK